ncbi:MAG TPA: ABC transporter permease [Terracidiphilus sp.]|nr:ABC transporter permease [Terracidiphilus sp.]
MLIQDVRYAMRQLIKSPGFTVTAVITLALGIGANTAIFTLVQGILLRSLPVADPAHLYRIGDTDDCCVNGGFVGDNGDFDIYSFDLYQHLKASAPEFEQLAAVEAGLGTWSVRRGTALSKPLHEEFVTGNYFTTLGIGPWTGRVFSEADDQEGAAPATVLSYHAWQSELGADPAIVGSTLYIKAKPFTVIGVAPPGFFGDRVTDSPPDLWLPVRMEPFVRGDGSILHHPDQHWLYPIGRVKPGTDIAQLQSKLSVALRNWLYSRPTYTDNGGKAIIPKEHVVIVPGGGGIQSLQQQTGKGLDMLMILSTVVLLIACANIANLLLARSTSRRADVAVRVAMGASHARLIRQILTESVLLSCIGGLVGLAVAYGGSHTILALAFPDAHDMPISAAPSLTVLGFAFLVSLVTGALFGTAPAWLSSQAQPADVLRGSTRTTRDSTSLPQKSLVVLQAALSLVLLAGAILMSKSLANLENQNFGVATANRYVLHFDPVGAGYTVERMPSLYREIENRFSALPGLSHIGIAMYSPLEGDNWGECVIQQGRPAPGPNDRCGSTWDRVSPGFLDSVGVPIVLGRGITEADTATSPFVAVVNQTFVKRYFPKGDPIGQHFGIDDPQFSGSFEIVGVFHDFKMNNPRDDVRPVYLRPFTQQFFYRDTMHGDSSKFASLNTTEIQSMNLQAIVIDFSHTPPDADALIRHTMSEVDPKITVMDLRTFSNQVAGNFNEERLVARLTSLFGILALILASVGLYGVTAYFAARRTGEIGIRMALGATRSSVVGMVLRTALWQILFGLAIGIPAALFAGHLMASQLYGVGAYDPLALAGATAVLALCAVLAGFIPARRAASIEPMQALRTE